MAQKVRKFEGNYLAFISDQSILDRTTSYGKTSWLPKRIKYKNACLYPMKYHLTNR